jgi:hypothetical protein
LFFTSAHGTGSGFASGGTYFSGSAPLFSNGYAYQHVTTNIDPSPAVADIALTFYFDWPWYAAVGAPGLDQYDLTSALLHEISRGLGLLSLTDAQGNSIVSPHLLTKWDDLLETGRGKKLWNSATALFQGVPSDLTGADGGVFFTGLYARLVFGGRPPIYAPPTFEPGSSMCYWNTGGKIAGNAVMEPTLSPGEVMREYALVDRGALKDIGYQNVVIPFMFTEVPQGGWYEVGQRLDLRVAAIGTVGQVTYQWQQDGSDVFEATSQHYVVESLDVHDTGRYVCVLTDEAKAEHISPPGYITVFEQGTLPTTGIVGLAIVAVACVLAGAFIILRRG